ncbi:MAG: hypothetical protein FJ406_12480 [Verrucomicrobia bacterium]|nr:hypothetical protein [Verrucomicrobiota bacterium]MBM3871274.1 hypothetical protein [Verrucomicrobiota bacterium]
MKLIISTCLISAVLFLFTGCETAVPKGALAMTPTTLDDRKMQSRRFQTRDEEKVLKACAALLQDLGFNLSESSPKVGLIVGYKDRSAVEGGQVAAKVLFAVIGANMPIDINQRLKASVVTKPSGENADDIVVRVTFQRMVYNEYNQVSQLEQLKDPKQYQEFFSALSKSLFLTANDI